MSRTIANAGALAAALLVASAGAAAAESAELPGSSGTSGPGEASLSAEMMSEVDVGEMFGSVTGSLPGYATGPFGSTATFACNVGSAAGLAATAVGTPLPVPVGIVCMVAKPVAESADALLDGDAEGSVSAVVGGVPVVGASIEDEVDTGSATESVEGSVGDRLGSIAEGSLTPGS